MFLNISQNSQENTCARVSLLIKLHALGLQLYYKRDSGTGVLLWILRNFWEQLFCRTPPDDCFCRKLCVEIYKTMNNLNPWFMNRVTQIVLKFSVLNSGIHYHSWKTFKTLLKKLLKVGMLFHVVVAFEKHDFNCFLFTLLYQL